MRLQVLAMSDTHLGEPTSVFDYNSGRKHFVQELRSLLNLAGTERAQVDELVVMGDTVDRCLADSNQIYTHGQAFFNSLQSVLDIGKLVYLPGNHDHTMWTQYSHEQYDQWFHSTVPEGEVLSERDKPLSPHLKETARDLLSILRCYDGGPFDGPGLTAANPVYTKVLNDREYVFAHGTHFRWDVTRPVVVKEILEILGHLELLDRAGRPFPVLKGLPEDAQTLEQLEEFVSPFVDFLWASAGDDPTPPRDRFWFLMLWLSGRLNNPHRTACKSRWFNRSQLPGNKQIGKLEENGIFRDSSLTLWKKFFRDRMIEFLNRHNKLSDNVTFVYGDTHAGGFTEDFPVEFNGRTINMRIYNTGAWVVDQVGSHPACHLFVVKEQDGQLVESMMDLSFSKAVEAGKPLLEVAGRDAEHCTPDKWTAMRAMLQPFTTET